MRLRRSLSACLVTLTFGAAVAAGCSSDGAAKANAVAATDAGDPSSSDASSPAILTGTCGSDVPRGGLEAPDPPAYSGGVCPTLTAGAATESTLTNSGVARKFMIIVPDQIAAGEKLPLVFLWHWLGGSAEQFRQIIDAQNAANTERFIAVIPESIGGTADSPGSTPISRWRGWAVPNPDSMRDEELLFFDDMLACVSEQFPVDKNCVSSAGVSDGALWTSQLIGARGQYLSSAVVLSGGVSDGKDENAALVRQYQPSTHPMPVLALWGGPTDICIILKFETATKELEKHLEEEGHFIVECQHNCGHAVPPIDVVAGESLFSPFISFVRQHPYWTTAGHSPYETTGLPAGMPSWCAIGAGNAVARTGACLNRLGC